MSVKTVAWQTGNGNITLTYQGQGDGSISLQSDANDGGARSQLITIETIGGAITKGFTINQAACPFPVGDVRNYAYNGSYYTIELPAGQYKLQVWGAQGGSNAAASSYGITAKAGGKGGYSEGIITLSTKTTVRVTVGGAGSSSAGGFNGGGSTAGSSTYNSDDEQGVSRMGGGGGATDIRLSDGSLLSRMIVAGGGAGGAMCYQKKTTTVTNYTTILDFSYTNLGDNTWRYATWGVYADNHSLNPMLSQVMIYASYLESKGVVNGSTLRITLSDSHNGTYVCNYTLKPWGNTPSTGQNYTSNQFTYTYTAPSSIDENNVLRISIKKQDTVWTGTVKVELVTTTTTTTTTNESQVGGVGGGTQGGAYSSTYAGKQNAAGKGGSFGKGANQTTTNYRYCSGAGGGGWYGGGGGRHSDSDMDYCKQSGGGSGFVNTAANASYRPSGYTGLQLDSGTTYAGNQSFPSPSGGNETGHAGDGYARITRLA